MPTTQEIANDLVAMCREEQFMESGEKYWADDVVSLEPGEGEMTRVESIAGVRGKGEWWEANHEVHDVAVEGPYLNGEQFTVRFKMDVTPKGGARMVLDEIALYSTRDGKIVEERFFYGS